MNTYKFDIKHCLSFLLFFSLFFNTENNVFVFYIIFILNFIYLFFCLTSRLKLRVEPFIYLYCIFFFWCLVSVLWARNVDLVISMGFRMAIVVVAIFFTINLQDKKNSIVKSGYYGLLFGVVVNVPLTLFGSLYISERFSGTTINPNHISLLSGFVIFLSIVNRKNLNKLIFISIIILSSYLIIQSGSRKGLILVFVSLCMLIFNISDRKIVTTYSFILTAFSFSLFIIFVNNLDYFSTLHPIFERLYDLTHINVNDLSKEGFGGDNSSRWRMIFIVEGFNIFQQYPFTGIGLDNFKTLYSEDLYSHNNYIEILSTLGLVGFIIYYSFCFYLLRPLLKGGKLLLLFMVAFFLSMDFAMVSYFERIYILPIIYIFFFMAWY